METGLQQRAYWVDVAQRLAEPVLSALASRQLRTRMPIESKFGADDRDDRAHCTHLEAFARLLVGIAPWIELGDDGTHEGGARARYAELAREGIDAATDPASPDYMNYGSLKPDMHEHGRNQALVDTAFLAQAILRAPTELWQKLSPRVADNVVAALVESRQIVPGRSNWLLFSASVEAALFKCGAQWDPLRVAYSVGMHADWYVGDGTYGDGPHFHWDYYNSFVIQPMLLDVLGATDPDDTGRFGMNRSTALVRAQRFAGVLERLISPEGAIPPIGRSLAYRMGALHLLAQVSLLDALPPDIVPAQVRCALSGVMHRLMDAPGTFDGEGWLRIGFAGAQPGLGEPYISTGSLYLCSAALLPLGLPPSAAFWSDSPTPWTSQRIYGGHDSVADHAI